MDRNGQLARFRAVLRWLVRNSKQEFEQARLPPPPSELRHLIQNSKVLGSAYARQLYASGVAGPGVPPQSFPIQVRLGSGLCLQQHMEQPWSHYWCSRLGMVPLYHRKVWEDCFLAQALWEAGMLNARRRAIGFAVGREMMPAFFAAHGVEVLATDLAADDLRSRSWQDTGQHAGETDHLFWPHLIDRETFDQRVAFRPVDMNMIPAELRDGSRDFVWSVCSFEHVGSIRQGLDFVVNGMECLKPGGIAVHTTEFNLDNDGPTIEEGGTVLFQRRHIEELGNRLADAGHTLMTVDYSTGDGVLDRFVDLPPFAEPDGRQTVPDTPHLRLAFGDITATSIGLIIRAKR